MTFRPQTGQKNNRETVSLFGISDSGVTLNLIFQFISVVESSRCQDMGQYISDLVDFINIKTRNNGAKQTILTYCLEDKN